MHNPDTAGSVSPKAARARTTVKKRPNKKRFRRLLKYFQNSIIEQPKALLPTKRTP